MVTLILHEQKCCQRLSTGFVVVTNITLHKNVNIQKLPTEAKVTLQA